MKHKKSKLAKLNEKYFKMYKGWSKVYCPALEADVHFTNKGWAHIQREKWRVQSEKESRLKFLALGRQILEKTTTIQNKRLQLYHGTLHQHYEFTAIIGGTRVTVVVIEDRGQFDFLSVFKVTAKPL